MSSLTCVLACSSIMESGALSGVQEALRAVEVALNERLHVVPRCRRRRVQSIPNAWRIRMRVGSRRRRLARR